MTVRQNRRRFFRDAVLLTTGAAGGLLLPAAMRNLGTLAQSQASADEQESSAEERLSELGIELPSAPQPVAVYVPAVRVGNTLYVSGHGPREADGELVQGKLGSDMTVEQGYGAARVVGLNVLSTVRDTLGSLDRVVRLAKVTGMVNCTPDFTRQPQVVNGFSELMVQVFGETAGKGARSAVGMSGLPSNIAVEIDAVFEVRS